MPETPVSNEIATLSQTKVNHEASVARLTAFLKNCDKQDEESATRSLAAHKSAIEEITIALTNLTKPKV